jgi:predicted peptidase
MDVIGALYTVRGQIKAQGLEFNENRIYSMGGSGGGNVTQMAMKLAPHTFACGVDICGMPGLIDAIAFGTGDGTNLNAGYSRDPQSPAFLTKDMQEIRDFGNPLHCRILHAANPKLKIVIVHGAGDKTCPLLPKITQYRNMLESGISVDAHFITEFDVDGSIIKDTGHAVGNREQVVVKFADVYMKENGAFAKSLSAPNDFSRKGKVEYPTSNGKYIIDYSSYPNISFEAK